jgi:glucose-6-phosphate 1-dehydrogenase
MAGLNQGEPWSFARIVIEKPYGRDVASAQALDATMHRGFAES